tara:strand:+ start:2615 stop:3073 length:459 start_codon:yes stop_codon:yes gene_type:complete
MNLKVIRYNSASDHTNSILLVNGKFECYGLEDEFRSQKVWGETRVSDGIYDIGFRNTGGFNSKYTKKYTKKFDSSWHKGMLEIKNVPNFKYVLIHIGNSDKDTAACYLIGDINARGENWLSNSSKAYERLYPKVRNALRNKENVTIEFESIA